MEQKNSCIEPRTIEIDKIFWFWITIQVSILVKNTICVIAKFHQDHHLFEVACYLLICVLSSICENV
jgi:hypothetical protein